MMKKTLKKTKKKKNEKNLINEKFSIKSLEFKKREINKKLLNEVVINRLLLEKRRKKARSLWSKADFAREESRIVKDSLNNFKTFGLLTGKSSCEFLLDREFVKNKMKNMTNKASFEEKFEDIFTKEKFEENAREEFLYKLAKNQKDFEAKNREICKKNLVIQQLRYDICETRRKINGQFLKVFLDVFCEFFYLIFFLFFFLFFF